MWEVDDIMSNNAKKDDVVVLREREFKRVKNGLDEAQVEPFIDELIEERDKLAHSQEHIASLTRLAEITVVEADKLATQIKTETAEQAKAESTAIIDKAKEQARQITEQKIAEAEEIANKQANAIKAKAEEEAVLLLENEKKKIQSDLRNLVNQQFGYMLEELEGLKQRAAAVQADFGNKLSEPMEEKSDVTVKIPEERDAAAAAVEITRESDTIIAEEKDAAGVEIANESDIIVAEEKDAAAVEIAKEIDTIVAEAREAAAVEIANESDTIVAEEKDAAAAEIANESDTIVAEEEDAAAAEIATESDTTVAEERDAIAAEASKKTLDEYLEPSQAMDHIEKSSELSKLLQIEEQAELGKPQWEVEILPPFDITKIMEVVSYLDQLPGVANTEMIVPQIDMPSILVFLREPINLIDVLQAIPAVAYIEEVATDKAASNGKPRKVRIGFSENTTSPEKK
jgi:hypothetical protein